MTDILQLIEINGHNVGLNLQNSFCSVLFIACTDHFPGWGKGWSRLFLFEAWSQEIVRRNTGEMNGNTMCRCLHVNVVGRICSFARIPTSKRSEQCW